MVVICFTLGRCISKTKAFWGDLILYSIPTGTSPIQTLQPISSSDDSLPLSLVSPLFTILLLFTSSRPSLKEQLCSLIHILLSFFSIPLQFFRYCVRSPPPLRLCLTLSGFHPTAVWLSSPQSVM